MNNQIACHYCEGKGYTEILDCSGDIQRTERCSFCEGLGFTESQESVANDRSDRTIKVSNSKVDSESC